MAHRFVWPRSTKRSESKCSNAATNLLASSCFYLKFPQQKSSLNKLPTIISKISQANAGDNAMVCDVLKSVSCKGFIILN